MVAPQLNAGGAHRRRTDSFELRLRIGSPNRLGQRDSARLSGRLPG
jgi:hypothetical protein